MIREEKKKEVRIRDIMTQHPPSYNSIHWKPIITQLCSNQSWAHVYSSLMYQMMYIQNFKKISIT
jgi:hypothetical protein